MNRTSNIQFLSRIVLVCGMLFAGMAGHAADIYVKGSVSGPGTGTIGDPFKTIEAAIAAAAADTTIRVTAGTYAPASPLILAVANLRLLGGYSADFLTTDSANKSIIDGGAAIRGILVDKVGGFRVDNFKIRNCTADTGGGTKVDWQVAGALTGTINSCVFEYCVATGGGGGAVHMPGTVDNQALTMTNVEVANCSATGGTAGGIWCQRVSQDIRLNLDRIVIRDCTSAGNYAALNVEAKAFLNATNILVYNCTSTGSGVVHAGGTNSWFSNATITKCTAQGYILACNAGTSNNTVGRCMVFNTIVANNTVTAPVSGTSSVFAVVQNLGNSTTWYNNLYFGNTGATAIMTYLGAVIDLGSGNWPQRWVGNLTSDPLFVNASGNNFSLQSSSPAIDAAITSYTSPLTLLVFHTPTVDFDGTARPSWDAGGVDIGAYEYQLALVKALSYEPLSMALDFGSRQVDTTSTVQSVILTNEPSATDDVAISNIVLGGTNPGDFKIVSGDADTTLTAGASVNVNITFTPSALGARSATLSVTHDDTALLIPLEFALTGNGSSATEIPPAAVDGWWKLME